MRHGLKAASVADPRRERGAGIQGIRAARVRMKTATKEVRQEVGNGRVLLWRNGLHPDPSLILWPAQLIPRLDGTG